MNTYTAQRQLRATIAQVLRGAPTLSDYVRENRPLPLPQSVPLQIHLNYVDSNPTRMAISGAPIDWDTDFELVVKARNNGTDSAEDCADAVWFSAFGRLMADQTLGGQVAYLEPGVASVSDDEVDTDVCTLTWRFTVRHSTGINTLDPR